MFRLKRNLRKITASAFRRKSWRKGAKTVEILGADYETVFNHIENQFTNEINWKNRGEWDIDHIIPLASATNEKELYALCHYSNLQPLLKSENQSKNNFYDLQDKDKYLEWYSINIKSI